MKHSNCCGTKGRLEVICGSMFSGKSERLIERMKRAELARQKTITFKHSLDTRKTIDHIASHAGNRLKALAIDDPQTILKLTPDEAHVVGIDEVQFFADDIIDVIMELVRNGKRVIVSGLDLDFRGKPFGPIPMLMAIADDVSKLHAICLVCGDLAHFSQRLINGKPASYDSETVLIGADEAYQARCRGCYVATMPSLKQKS